MAAKAVFPCQIGRIEVELKNEKGFERAAETLRSQMRAGRRPSVANTASALAKAVRDGKQTFTAGFASNKATCEIRR